MESMRSDRANPFQDPSSVEISAYWLPFVVVARWETIHGCILALEDIAEPLYKIDRMLLQLEMSGVFHGITGILLGSFHNCNPPKDADYTLLDVFRRAIGTPQHPGLCQ